MESLSPLSSSTYRVSYHVIIRLTGQLLSLFYSQSYHLFMIYTSSAESLIHHQHLTLDVVLMFGRDQMIITPEEL